jgi:hypothetical protein
MILVKTLLSVHGSPPESTGSPIYCPALPRTVPQLSRSGGDLPPGMSMRR